MLQRPSEKVLTRIPDPNGHMYAEYTCTLIHTWRSLNKVKTALECSGDSQLLFCVQSSCFPAMCPQLMNQGVL